MYIYLCVYICISKCNSCMCIHVRWKRFNFYMVQISSYSNFLSIKRLICVPTGSNENNPLIDIEHQDTKLWQCGIN